MIQDEINEKFKGMTLPTRKQRDLEKNMKGKMSTGDFSCKLFYKFNAFVVPESNRWYENSVI